MMDDDRQIPEGITTDTLEVIRFRAEKKDIIGDNDDALRVRLMVLEEEHRDLDTAIQALSEQSSPQTLVIARLKKKKLKLKDEIVRLRDLVEPDIIA